MTSFALPRLSFTRGILAVPPATTDWLAPKNEREPPVPSARKRRGGWDRLIASGLSTAVLGGLAFAPNSAGFETLLTLRGIGFTERSPREVSGLFDRLGTAGLDPAYVRRFKCGFAVSSGYY